MTIKLNLLNENQKRMISENIKLINVINNFIFLALILISGGLLTMAGEQYLKYSAKPLEETTISTPLDLDIAKTNEKIKQMEAIQKDYVKWSRVLLNFIKSVPENNTLSRVNFDKTNQKIFINGLAEKRDDFLKLEETMKKIEYISEISSPISNLLKRDNISFSIEAKLNL